MATKASGKLKNLIALHGPQCHICGYCTEVRYIGYEDKTILAWNKSAFRLIATIDHIIPVSKKGTGHFRNLKVAHKYCNNKRGSGEVTEELRRICKTWMERQIRGEDLKNAQLYYDLHRDEFQIPDHVKERLLLNKIGWDYNS